MQGKHTPKPWKVERLNYPDLGILNKSGDVSFEILGPPDRNGIIPLVCQTIIREVKSEGQLIEVDEANLSLISAAPELLQAAKDCLEEIKEAIRTDDPAALHQMEAWLECAIVKAEGRD